jgi:hypothetical protein
MERNWDSLSFFSFVRNGIFIFGGSELGFEKMLGMQMTGAEWFAAKCGLWSQIGQLGSVGLAKSPAGELNLDGQDVKDRAFLLCILLILCIQVPALGFSAWDLSGDDGCGKGALSVIARSSICGGE